MFQERGLLGRGLNGRLRAAAKRTRPVIEKPAVNITCADCAPQQLCSACQAAAKVLKAGGYHAVHSPRYDALRAALAGNYAFGACIVPVREAEGSVLDAVALLFAGKRVTIVHDAKPEGELPPDVRLLSPAQYARGDWSPDWFTAQPRAAPPGEAAPEVSQAESRRALRRVRSLAAREQHASAKTGESAGASLTPRAALDDELAWAQASEETFGLLLVRLGKDAAGTADQRSRNRDAVAALLSRSVRSADAVAVQDDDVLIILGGAEVSGTAAAAGRIAAAAAAPSARKAPRAANAARIGSATYPADGLCADALLGRAEASLRGLPSRACR